MFETNNSKWNNEDLNNRISNSEINDLFFNRVKEDLDKNTEIIQNSIHSIGIKLAKKNTNDNIFTF